MITSFLINILSSTQSINKCWKYRIHNWNKSKIETKVPISNSVEKIVFSGSGNQLQKLMPEARLATFSLRRVLLLRINPYAKRIFTGTTPNIQRPLQRTKLGRTPSSDKSSGTTKCSRERERKENRVIFCNFFVTWPCIYIRQNTFIEPLN